MIKVYSLNKITPIFWIFLIPIVLIGLFLIIPMIFLGIFLAIIYYSYKKAKKLVSQTIKNLRKRKIKITGTSENGDVKINFSQNIPIEELKEARIINEISILETSDAKSEKWEIKQFINYLKSYGLTETDEKIYYFDKSVFPLYKKSYPVNEVIKIYEETIFADLVVLGLKGEPSDPKLLYVIPSTECKQRMTIDELKKYEINLKNQEINSFN
ncbi:conserved hypothetical protein [Methanococcus vannielii SB]|jgi:hypothetical protein|uniref:Uncharacterized protein n=1 Tax=Methanococcus vannielii (strain ATCC 35089 / DSM 1224 / JCM 13029 / OCM 148 / SB) TaxID=406327 RepID=A6UPV6_METVS|nr:hypothetical protein [Methanococcus vannielii]ABR54528.1 conserved hypothetical protein [Methanococcus vannielii SB]